MPTQYFVSEGLAMPKANQSGGKGSSRKWDVNLMLL